MFMGMGIAPETGVSDISVVCTTRTAKLSGSVQGLTAEGLVLRNVSGGVTSELSVASNATRFSFSEYPDETPFAISIASQPEGLYCELSNATGTMNVETILQGVQVKCEPTFTISGSIFGGSGPVSLALTSSLGDEQTQGTDTFTFSTRLPEGAAFNVSVTTQPLDRRCNVLLPELGSVMGATNLTSVSVVCVASVVPALDAFTRFGAWARNATEACDAGTPETHRSACFHAGEKRRVTIPHLSSCTDVSATDALSAFEWTCRANTDSIEITSVMLRPGKKLSDLIDFAQSAWRKNSVIVTVGAFKIESNDSADWWSNPVVVLEDGAAVETAGTVYVIRGTSAAAENVARSLSVSLDSAIVVVAPNVTLTPPAGTIVDWQGSFGWFEGTLSPQPGATAFALSDLTGNNRFNTLRGVRVFGGAVGISMSGTPFANMVTDTQLSAQTSFAASLIGREHLLRDIAVNNGAGLSLSGSGHVLIDSQMTSTSGDALTLSGADLFVGNVTLAHIDGAGVAAQSLAGASFLNLALVNVRPVGLSLDDSDDNDFNGLGIYGSDALMDFHGTSDRARFIGRIALGAVSGPTGVLGLSGVSGSVISEQGVVTTNPLLVASGLDASAAFVGAVTLDTRNTSVRNMFGIATTNVAGFDWFNFENTRRAWGKPKGMFEINAPSLAGPAGTLAQFWDYSLSSAASGGLRGGNVKPNLLAASVQTATHRYTGGGNCALAYPGSVLADGRCTTTYVRNAVEILQDGEGNENGLCEAGERCIHTPNLGRAQGKGKTTEAEPFAFDGVTGVRLVSSASF